ncbi:MAG: SAM-dependent methyltransferase, partial [Gemmatimonadota bacterium]|nr:SAM-dependent methyltransferase [Gemmatimonadota bacterium]
MTQGRVDRREHWDIVYSSKPEDAVSWFQSIPEVSLALVAQVVDPASARVIDVGGGTSRLV